MLIYIEDGFRPRKSICFICFRQYATPSVSRGGLGYKVQNSEYARSVSQGGLGYKVQNSESSSLGGLGYKVQNSEYASLGRLGYKVKNSEYATQSVPKVTGYKVQVNSDYFFILHCHYASSKEHDTKTVCNIKDPGLMPILEQLM